jgi:pyruvate carboxylase
LNPLAGGYVAAPEFVPIKKLMQKLLALNRGEIAIRILRAANELGLRTVAVYSQEDRLSLHRFKADEAYLIGEGKGPVQAYLDVENIVALAAEKKVDAIHPGYGFLSENPALPRACAKHGVTFVGPSAELLEQLGDKTAARTLAQKAGVPTVPGTEEAITDLSTIEATAAKIGFPLIVKAAFGGGGRGMRVVNAPEDLLTKVGEAQQEALAAFGNGAARVTSKCRSSATRTATFCICSNAIVRCNGGIKRLSKRRRR